jgi:hypothetical protein
MASYFSEPNVTSVGKGTIEHYGVVTMTSLILVVAAASTRMDLDSECHGLVAMAMAD